MWLKQSTAATLAIGPFVDDTDGKTAETALTISQADVRLSKNGAAFAQKSDTTAATHMENGYYSCPLNATDTGTLGRLRVAVAESGALPVWQEFLVLPANIYDSLVLGTDLIDASVVQIAGVAVSTTTAQLGVNVVQVSGDATAADNAESFFDGTGYAGTNNVIPTVTTTTNLTNKGDGSGYTAIPWNAAWDAEVQSEVADALAVYDPPTNAEILAAHSTTDALITAVDDLVDTEVAAIKTVVDAIEVDTQDIQGRLPAALVSGRMSSDVVAISGDTTAADRLEALMDGLVIGQVNGVATTTSIPADGFTEATNDHFLGRLITFLTGALVGQQTAISDYVGATQTFTVTALTEAPADNDFFIIH